MATPNVLRKLDNRVLGDRFRKKDVMEARATDDDADVERTDGERTEEAREGTPRGSGPRFGTGDGFRQFLTIFYRIAALVFLLLAVICILGIVFTLAPTNEDNSLVSNVLDIAKSAAGPFKDVFTVMDNPDREVTVNYGFAAAIYLVIAFVIGKLPGGKS